MKKLSLSIALSFFATLLFSQTLFTYGTQSVSKEEFLRAYNKNNTSSTDKKTALREYLDLYIKFKLKVKAAKDERIDTLANINNDLQNFRSQIEESYLNDEKEVNALVDEAFDRSQKDIHVMHLFIPAKSGDTTAFKNVAEEAYQALLKNISFNDEVKNLSGRSVNASTGDLGFITVFSVPYEFENIIYNLKPGQVSKPYRTKNGFHLFKNIEERPAAGKIKVAQILIAFSPAANEEQKKAALLIADSVYKKLRSGADFFEMAKAVSNDQNTYMDGGIMPEFGTGKYDAAFENMAFALKKDSDITVPFQTSFGYHILKRLSLSTLPKDKSDADNLSQLKQQVQQDGRIATAKEKFLKSILKTLGYKKNIAVNESQLWAITDSFVVSNKKISSPNLTEKTILFSFTNKKILVGEWLKFAKEYKNDPVLYKDETDAQLMEKFISNTAFDTYRKNLEKYNPEFKYQLQEFKDGNMLFEIMEKNVWSKASADSAGLLKYFNQHKNNYNWKESADVILFSCSNEKAAQAASSELGTKNWHEILEANNLQLQADSGRYELSQIPVKSESLIREGVQTEPLVNDADGTATFVKVIHTYPANQPRTFEEARGLIVNDYQNLLEEKWIEQLKKKYPVKINEAVFQSL